MVDEKISRRVDSCGRISLPKHLRLKYNMDIGEEVEFFTCEIEGKQFVCLKAKETNTEEEGTK